MKLKSLLITLGLSLTVGVGAAVALTASKVEVKEIEKVEAATWILNPTFYFCPSDKWTSYNATFKMNGFDNFWSGKTADTSAVGTKMNDTYNGRDIYKFVITSGTWVSHIQFLRMDSTGSSQWDYSEVFEHSNYYSGVNFVLMDAGHSWDDAWVPGTTDSSGNSVYWVNTTDFIFKASECSTPSRNTTRLFVYNSGTHWASGGKTCVRAWGESATKTLWTDGDTAKTANSLYNLSWFQDDNNEYYGYCDIPVDIQGFQLAEFTAEDDTSAVQVTADYNSQNLWLSNTDGYSNCVIYCASEGNNVSFGGAHEDECGAILLTKVLEAIDTCYDGDYNGVSSYGRINYYFYNNGTKDIATAAAQSATITTLNGTAASAATHMAALSYRNTYGITGSSRILVDMLRGGSNGSSGSTMTIVIASALTIVAVAGYFYLRTRKED